MSDNSTAATALGSREAQQRKDMQAGGQPGSELAAAASQVCTSLASAANDAAGERPGGPDIGRDLHRLLAGAVANHLEYAAALLRRDPGFGNEFWPHLGTRFGSTSGVSRGSTNNEFWPHLRPLS